MASISMAQAEKLVIATWDGYTPKDMVEKFKAGGPGWQTRIDEALRKAAGL